MLSLIQSRTELWDVKKFSNDIVVKIIVILQIYSLSYRSSVNFFNKHPELMYSLVTDKIPDFRTQSYRAIRMDWHEIKAGNLMLHRIWIPLQLLSGK